MNAARLGGEKGWAAIRTGQVRREPTQEWKAQISAMRENISCRTSFISCVRAKHVGADDVGGESRHA